MSFELPVPTKAELECVDPIDVLTFMGISTDELKALTKRKLRFRWLSGLTLYSQKSGALVGRVKALTADIGFAVLAPKTPPAVRMLLVTQHIQEVLVLMSQAVAFEDLVSADAPAEEPAYKLTFGPNKTAKISKPLTVQEVSLVQHAPPEVSFVVTGPINTAPAEQPIPVAMGLYEPPWDVEGTIKAVAAGMKKGGGKGLPGPSATKIPPFAKVLSLLVMDESTGAQRHMLAIDHDKDIAAQEWVFAVLDVTAGSATGFFHVLRVPYEHFHPQSGAQGGVFQALVTAGWLSPEPMHSQQAARRKLLLAFYGGAETLWLTHDDGTVETYTIEKLTVATSTLVFQVAHGGKKRQFSILQDVAFALLLENPPQPQKGPIDNVGFKAAAGVLMPGWTSADPSSIMTGQAKEGISMDPIDAVANIDFAGLDFAKLEQAVVAATPAVIAAAMTDIVDATMNTSSVAGIKIGDKIPGTSSGSVYTVVAVAKDAALLMGARREGKTLSLRLVGPALEKKEVQARLSASDLFSVKGKHASLHLEAAHGSVQCDMLYFAALAAPGVEWVDRANNPG